MFTYKDHLVLEISVSTCGSQTPTPKIFYTLADGRKGYFVPHILAAAIVLAHTLNPALGKIPRSYLTTKGVGVTLGLFITADTVEFICLADGKLVFIDLPPHDSYLCYKKEFNSTGKLYVSFLEYAKHQDLTVDECRVLLSAPTLLTCAALNSASIFSLAELRQTAADYFANLEETEAGKIVKHGVEYFKIIGHRI